MSAQPWHCDPVLLRRYDDGATDDVLSASIEAHLVRCSLCRARLAGVADPAELEAAWAGVREAIQRPALPPALRLLRRAGLGEVDAVLLSASQSLRGPWTLAMSSVLAFAVWSAVLGDRRTLAFYLLVAPLVPVLGVVTSFSSADPTAELAGATPYSKIRLTLLRTAAVTVTTVPLAVLLGALVPGIGWLSVAWLGPALGLTMSALVAMTWWSPETSGTVVSAAWAAVVVLTYSGRDISAAIQFPAQTGYLALAAVATAVLAARIRSAHTPGGYA